MKDQPRCRLHFIFARKAPVAVIFRRGPSRWVQVIKWNTAKDTFDLGQWFHGRIYERRCDLTPSGHLMVYFASKQGRRQSESEYTASWSAVSKPPWLTALALWPKGNCWAGGGAFADDRTLLLNQGNVPHPSHIPPSRHLRVKVQAHGGEDSPLFACRLKRDGWVQKARGTRHSWKNIDPPELWVRSRPKGSEQVIRRLWGFFKQKGGIIRSYNETFAVRTSKRAAEIPLPDAQWADWDQQGRLVLAKAGQIVLATIEADKQITERTVADFNSAKPSPHLARVSARKW